MKAKVKKIENDSDFSQKGYKKYIQDVEVTLPENSDYDGLLSLCIDSRIPVTPIYKRFPSKEPISTAGNALFPEITSLSNFTDDNVVVSHGIHPNSNPSAQPNCGGHIIAFDEDKNNVFMNLIQNLRPCVKNSFNDYDPFLTTRNLAQVWNAPQARFYDHNTGWLYDVDDIDNTFLGINPSIFHEGLHPSIGQDPSLIVINTLGKPYFAISHGHKARKLGGMIEIFYPKPELTDSIIESLVFCLQGHYRAKKKQNDGDNKQRSQFESSDTLLFLTDSTENLEILTNSILRDENFYHKKYIEGFFTDPKDKVIGLVPEADNQLFEITAS